MVRMMRGRRRIKNKTVMVMWMIVDDADGDSDSYTDCNVYVDGL